MVNNCCTLQKINILFIKFSLIKRSLVAFPKLRRQLLYYDPAVQGPKDFSENTLFWINHEFCIIKNGKTQKRGKVNLIGRLQLSTERSQQEDNHSIVQLRILRTQEAIIKIMKMRKYLTNASLQVIYYLKYL